MSAINDQSGDCPGEFRFALNRGHDPANLKAVVDTIKEAPKERWPKKEVIKALRELGEEFSNGTVAGHL